MHTEPSSGDIVYPDSDGQPMADNTLQFEWIVTIQGNLDVLVSDFVGGDLLWYPVEGDSKTRIAPDALVAFGRPKGHRGSYKQWEEGNVAPQVVWEILSPGNRAGEMRRKRRFYERFGVEEYYVYDPDKVSIEGWRRHGDLLVPISDMQGYVSPRLQIRFECTDTLHLFNPDGTAFMTFAEIEASRRAAEARAAMAESRAETAEARAETAESRAETAEVRAETAEARAEAMAARLRALGIDPEQLS